ncbi:hypothetical protein ZWY2020_038604 [Hordeum vulgare]|nr:hypothetical protein ZWY2020_038604 [Hordeum vulgare]
MRAPAAAPPPPIGPPATSSFMPLPPPPPGPSAAGLRAAGKSRVEPAPEAQAAEFFVYRSVVIVKDGEDVTTKAMDAFAERFKDQLQQEVLCAMRELFHLDDAHATTLEDALIQHGGEGDMDVKTMKDVATVIHGSI